MDDDEFEDEALEPPSVRWSWWAALAHALETVEGVLDAVSGGVREVKLMLCHHHNYVFDKRTFAEEARAEIESIPTQEG